MIYRRRNHTYLDERKSNGGGLDFAEQSAAYPLDELVRHHEDEDVRVLGSLDDVGYGDLLQEFEGYNS